MTFFFMIRHFYFLIVYLSNYYIFICCLPLFVTHPIFPTLIQTQTYNTMLGLYLISPTMGKKIHTLFSFPLFTSVLR